MEALLSTDPDPDHVTHAHAGEGPAPEAVSDHSPTPSIDSDKENNVEMVNLLRHPTSPGKPNGPHSQKQPPVHTFVEVAEDEDEEEEQRVEEQLMKDRQESSARVYF